MKIAIEKFWCVKYYKAQPYNMEHTLCVYIVKEDLERLERAFEKKYHRPLKGTNLGQFHTDFASFTGREDVQQHTHTQSYMK